jgi:hypothetical protein
MHAELLVRVLAAIEPEKVMSLDSFQRACAISSKSVAKSVLDYLEVNNIGSVSKNTVKFSGSDRIHAALLTLQMRGDIEQVSTYLSWKDFERLASEVLRSFGYRTWTNVRFAKPRMEIDVVGTSSDGFTIAVDCKHWKRSNLSSISNFSQKQAVRAEWLIKYQKTMISQVVPVMLTLHAESVSFINGVPLVPIHKFRSFIMDVKGFLPKMYVVSASSS